MEVRLDCIVYTNKAAMKLFCAAVLLMMMTACAADTEKDVEPVLQPVPGPKHREATIAEIPTPAGYERIPLSAGSFSRWLRNYPLRTDSTLYLYGGTSKGDQSLHYAVLDLSTRELQQCADALMRLRAEYYFSVGALDSIRFLTGNGSVLSLDSWQRDCRTHDCLMRFMNNVFNNCGTYSIKAMTKPRSPDDMVPGDVLVRPGSPGHSMMIADVAVDRRTGKKVFLLLQSYMPAQDTHIVRNLENSVLSPWYEVDLLNWISTPGYMFAYSDLRSWK